MSPPYSQIQRACRDASGCREEADEVAHVRVESVVGPAADPHVQVATLPHAPAVAIEVRREIQLRRVPRDAGRVARVERNLDLARADEALERALEEIRDAYNRAIEETRAGKMVEVQAPLNISSLGAFGVENATPIVVPPAMSTLFIGSAHEKMVKDGGMVYPMEVVTLSLTFDHRVVNGAGAAAFMMELKRQFETFRLPG